MRQFSILLLAAFLVSAGFGLAIGNATAAEGDQQEFVGGGGDSEADACEQAHFAMENAGSEYRTWEPVGECYGCESVVANYADGDHEFFSCRLMGIERPGEKYELVIDTTVSDDEDGDDEDIDDVDSDDADESDD